MELISLFSAFTYGLSSSLSLCLASCLPIFLPLLAGYGKDPKEGLKISMWFALGRFLGYYMLGTIAALMGALFISFFNDTFPKISAWIVFAFGLITIFYGTLILAKAELKLLGKHNCKIYLKKTRKINNPYIASGLLGFVSTITPCVPVFSFLLLPFAVGRVLETSIITIAFGLGANLVFLALGVSVTFGIKNVGDKLYHWRRPIEIISAALLIVFGLFYLIWAVGPLLFGWKYDNFILPTVFDFFDFVSYFLNPK